MLEVLCPFQQLRIVRAGIVLAADTEHGTFDFLEEDTLDGVLGSLAEKYKVSKQALAYRLVNLGYVSP